MKLTELHPSVFLTYFFILIIFALLFDDIYYLLTFLIAILLLIVLQGAKSRISETVKFFIPICLLISILNPLFSHNGTTKLVLFSNFSITLEALIYGLLMALSLFIIYLIFVSFNSYVNYQKLLYLASNHFPNICMILIMAMRFVSLLTYRFNEVKKIHSYEDKSKIERYGSLIAIVIAWSLEEAMVTAKSMKSRGYGITKRTNYLKFEFNTIDYLIILMSIVLSVIMIIGFTQGYGKISIYPTISPDFLQFKISYYYISFIVLLLPLIILEINDKRLLRGVTHGINKI